MTLVETKRNAGTNMGFHVRWNLKWGEATKQNCARSPMRFAADSGRQLQLLLLLCWESFLGFSR